MARGRMGRAGKGKERGDQRRRGMPNHSSNNGGAKKGTGAKKGGRK